MCGIFAIFGKICERANCNGTLENGIDSTVKTESLRELGYRSSKLQRHRGPDKTGVVHINDDNVIMIHERTRILGVLHGDQPLQSEDENLTLVANGEIYNYLPISDDLEAFYQKPYRARSDCDVIIGLYEKYGTNFIHHMDGMFAFALYDRKNKQFIAGRDPLGIISMYIGEDSANNIWIASEMKCLVEKCNNIRAFPPGMFLYD
jgi:asparagine synthase (glutamine-hydrolysing)